MHRGIKQQDIDVILLIQRLNNHPNALFCVLHLGAAHRLGSVQQNNHVLRNALQPLIVLVVKMREELILHDNVRFTLVRRFDIVMGDELTGKSVIAEIIVLLVAGYSIIDGFYVIFSGRIGEMGDVADDGRRDVDVGERAVFADGEFDPEVFDDRTGGHGHAVEVAVKLAVEEVFVHEGDGHVLGRFHVDGKDKLLKVHVVVVQIVEFHFLEAGIEIILFISVIGGIEFKNKITTLVIEDVIKK